MSKSSPEKVDCAVAQSLGLVGDRWTLMILRDAFHGIRTFDGFRESLGISTSVLSERLKTLVDAGILRRRRSDTDGRSFQYRLTKCGMALYPVLVGLWQWGEQWAPSGKGRRLDLLEKATGRPIAGAAVLSHDGRVLQPWEVRSMAGPGAPRGTKDRLK